MLLSGDVPDVLDEDDDEEAEDVDGLLVVVDEEPPSAMELGRSTSWGLDSVPLDIFEGFAISHNWALFLYRSRALSAASFRDMVGYKKELQEEQC